MSGIFLPDLGVYGFPPPDLSPVPAEARQFSPAVPGSLALEEFAAASLPALIIQAPPSTLERRHVLGLALRALAPGAPLTVMAAKDKGGQRLKKELEAFGCAVEETSKAHHRLCKTIKPDRIEGLDGAIAAGSLQRVADLGLWSQPGIFSWDRMDAGTALLMEQLAALKGRGADLGCGYGALAIAVLASPQVTRLDLIDIDRRAIGASRRNIDDTRANFHWVDMRTAASGPTGLDFVVTNPPFHDGGAEDRALGQAFIAKASQMLRAGGTLWITSNRHLSYEAQLAKHFANVTLKADRGGYKVYEAKR